MHLLPDAGRVRRFEPAIEFLVAPGISPPLASERTPPPNGQFRKAIIFALWSARDAGAAVADSENRCSGPVTFRSRA
ncbi:hypothetical protein V5799_032247 [Amblyomma americanum]|uniref:Uncharacterized protein n=1 Tax=Amblyomma americanum TaxID=6943 RepID=A0AAQ4DRQ4_AMBAM